MQLLPKRHSIVIRKITGFAALLCSVAIGAQASYLADWLPRYGLVARIGNEFISNYDITVEVIINRSLRGKISAVPPDHNEQGRAAARILSRQIILDAARRSSSAIPDANRITDLEHLLLINYNQSRSHFEAQTGVDWGKVRAQLIDRAMADAYIRDVLLPNLRSAGGSTALTLPVDRLQALEQLKSEILRLRERFFERQKIEIIDNRFSLEELLQLEDVLASM